MPDPVADYETAAGGFAERAGAVRRATSAWPSPCEGWTAQDIVDHVMGGTSYYTEAWGGQVPDVPDDADLRDALPTAAYRAARRHVPAAGRARSDGGRHRSAAASCPAAVMFGIYTSDTLIHTWDLARAIGVDVQLDQDLLQRTLGRADPDRGDGAPTRSVRAAVEIDDSAPMQDRAMAWFGRQP